MNKAVRLKWEMEDTIQTPAGNGISLADRSGILDLIDEDALTIHFQPILSVAEGAVFGYEALTRFKRETPYPHIGDLFKKAKETSVISSLDVKCRENAIKEAVRHGVRDTGAGLFINICPETLMHPAHSVGITDGLAEEWGMPKDSIVLELTEESAISNYNLFKQTVTYYRDRGYKIAIDDFGAGYGGLKMLSVIEPDFIKIDRHFISDINKAMVKRNLVDSIATACHRMGIQVIAEGVELEEEAEVILEMGITLFQGYFFGKPSPGLAYDTAPVMRMNERSAVFSVHRTLSKGETNFIGDIASTVSPLHPSTPVKDFLNRLIEHGELRSVPVADGERVMGMLHRVRFIENQVIGKCGYGMHLNSYKEVRHIMEREFLMVEAATPLEEVALRIRTRTSDFLYDDICVTRNGKYLGTVAVSGLLDAITEKNIMLARGANPLTGLPGNEAIQREIEKRVARGIHFDVGYIDLNNFKPYNDYYGFERGDCVIKKTAEILEETVSPEDRESLNFVGHIGGDDFIFITRPHISIPVSERIVAAFEDCRQDFHGAEDFDKGFYTTRNRKDEVETFGLLSLSIGILSTEVYTIGSYAQLASMATEIKKNAKKQASLNKGSAIVRDRRLMG